MISKQGLIAISTILVVIAIVMVITTTVALLSINEAQSSFALFRGDNTLHFVEGCTEDSLLKARASATFGNPVGTPVTITRPEGTCIVTVILKSGSQWTMRVTTNNATYVRTTEVTFNRTGTGITLISWKEI